MAMTDTTLGDPGTTGWSTRRAAWRSGFASAEVDTRLVGMVVGAGRDLDRLQHPVRRRLPHRPQPLEPVGPEHLDRHHGHRHGAHHRVAQHRPVGRIAARLPRLRHGDDPDRVASRARSIIGLEPAVHVDRRARCSAWSLGAADRRRPGFIVAYVGVPAFIVTLGGLPRLARPDLPDGHRGRRSRRWTPASSCSAAAPKGSLGEWRAGSSRCSPALGSCSASCWPAAVAALRLRRPADLGGRRHRRDRLRRRPRRDRGGEPLLLARELARRRRRGTGHPWPEAGSRSPPASPTRW